MTQLNLDRKLEDSQHAGDCSAVPGLKLPLARCKWVRNLEEFARVGERMKKIPYQLERSSKISIYVINRMSGLK